MRRPTTVLAAPSRFLLALTAALAACAGRVCPASRFESARAALEAHASHRAAVRGVRAEARVDRRDGDGRIRGTVLMFVQRPDRVRFDAMTQMGPAAILTSDGQTFALTDLREDRFYVGPPCPANIERLVGLPLAGQEVILLLLGEAPRIDAVREEIACEGGIYRIRLFGPDGRIQLLELEVAPQDERAPPAAQRTVLRATEVRAPDGALQWRVTWSDHRVVRDATGIETSLPFRVHFEHPGRGLDTLVRFESVEPNAEPPADAYVQQPRPGLDVQTVTCD